MPQMHLPLFVEGQTPINAGLSFQKRAGKIAYYDGGIFAIAEHAESDVDAFRATVSQLCHCKAATQAEMARAFGVTNTSMRRGVKLFDKQGIGGFFRPRRTRGPAVLTPLVLAKAQELLDQGLEVADVADKLDRKRNTLAKAIRDGRLRKSTTPSAPQPEQAEPPCSKSQRSLEDSQAPMGMGATDTFGRVAASLGQLGSAPVSFQPAMDIPNGGVLCAVPALLATGLLEDSPKRFKLPDGFYGLANIFLLLAFLALARFKSIERLRYCAPGEWGKLLGLDRAPEVRTLRSKVKHLAEEGQPAEWSADLCADWMKAFPEQAMAFYLDGHVRVYHGHKAKLPRRYVARQKLCLRASTDYWVNAMDGQPFFVVYQDIDPGLIQVLVEQILPRLEREAPNQPTPEALEADPLLHRFTLVFDRAGYSPKLFRMLKERRIACLTYRKLAADDEAWCEAEFFTERVELVSGDVVEMRLGERGVLLGSKEDEQVWVREIRRLMPGGHQTSIICTDYKSPVGRAAAAMFARWCQENYFKYMRENYGIDRLVSHQTEDIPGSTKVVNPEHRRLEREVKTKAGTLSRKKAEWATIELTDDDQVPSAKMEARIQKSADLLTEVTALEEELTKLKQQRAAIDKHIQLSDLPEGQRLMGLSVGTKQLLDTIKMVAYRAETAMAHTLREKMSRSDDARSLLKAIYTNDVDLIPDHGSGTLQVRLHSLANRSSDAAVTHLCQELNDTETQFPGTELRMVFELVSPPQEASPDSDDRAIPGAGAGPAPFTGTLRGFADLLTSQNPRDQEV